MLIQTKQRDDHFIITVSKPSKEKDVVSQEEEAEPFQPYSKTLVFLLSHFPSDFVDGRFEHADWREQHWKPNAEEDGMDGRRIRTGGKWD